jgi:hypothetical protein
MLARCPYCGRTFPVPDSQAEWTVFCPNDGATFCAPIHPQERNWQTCVQALSMLQFLHGKASERKLRLFACACGRKSRIWRKFSNRRAAEVAARFADGQATAAELAACRDGLLGCACAEADAYTAAVRSALEAVDIAAMLGLQGINMDWADAPYVEKSNRQYAEEQAHQANLLRDIFGPLPFREVPVDPAWRSVNSGAVRDLAQKIYDDRDFAQLPILADALEDAGCSNVEILRHCREAGEHVRGCWVVDLVLEKS